MNALTTTSAHSPPRLKTRVGGSTSPRALRVGKIPRQPRGPHREITTRARRFTVASRKYLSPEPMLQKPTWVMAELQHGFQVPTYAYARNNPLGNIDPDGRLVFAPFAIPLWAWATGAGIAGFGIGFGASQLAPPVMTGAPPPNPAPIPAPTPTPGPSPAPSPGPMCGPGGGDWRRCVEKYRQDIQVCKDILVPKGLSTSDAKAVCQACLNDSLFACQSGSPRPSAPSAECVRNLGYYGLTPSDLSLLF